MKLGEIFRGTKREVAVSSYAGLQLASSERSPVHEPAYSFYLNAFEEVAKGDPEAEKMLQFFKERRKRAHLVGNRIIDDESGNSTNFYTAIVEPSNRSAFEEMPGAAQYKNEDNPTTLLLRNIMIDKHWAGVLAAHESVHVYQWLNNIEQTRPDGFMEGEVDAYELEFKLLDKLTEGNFKRVLKEQAKQVGEGKYRGRLSSQDLTRLQALFSPIKSQEEYVMRISAYTIAFNYAVAELQGKNPDDVRRAKVDYTRNVISGKFQILPA